MPGMPWRSPKKEVRLVRVAGASITEVSDWPLSDVYEWTKGLEAALPTEGLHLLEPILHDMPTRLKRIIDVGLGYLSMNRQTVSSLVERHSGCALPHCWGQV